MQHLLGRLPRDTLSSYRDNPDSFPNIHSHASWMVVLHAFFLKTRQKTAGVGISGDLGATTLTK
jgi:hypothetical protein